MCQLSFVKSQANDCLYILWKKGEIIVLILVYIDDLAITSTSIKRVETFKAALSREFKILDLGELKYILGIQIIRNCKARTISMN